MGCYFGKCMSKHVYHNFQISLTRHINNLSICDQCLLCVGTNWICMCIFNSKCQRVLEKNILNYFPADGYVHVIFKILKF